MGNSHRLYKNYSDNLSSDEYVNWITNIFNDCDNILDDNGVILLNINYSSNSPKELINIIYNLTNNCVYNILDIISWKKASVIPNNSLSTLTRTCELIFVLYKNKVGRKNNIKLNKEIKHKYNNQLYYQNITNFITTNPQASVSKYNKATFPEELVEKLLNIYAYDKNVIVYDPFMGSGTTAKVCKKLGYKCIGSEIDTEQCKGMYNRLYDIKVTKNNSFINTELF